MAPSGTSNIVNLVVRGLQAFFAIIVLGISAGLLSDYYGSPSQFGYNLFVSLWTIIIVVPLSLLAVRFLAHLASPIILLALEALSWIFWLAAWAAAAATLHSYGYRYEHSKQAALTAFGVLEWLLFCYTLYAAVMAFLDHRRGGVSSKGGAQAAV